MDELLNECEDGRMPIDIIYNDIEEANDSTKEKYLLEIMLNM